MLGRLITLPGRPAKPSHCLANILRHTAASWFASQGATEQQLRAIGGWKSAVVSRYVHLAAKDTRDLVAKMNAQMLGAGR